jgi:hypothetical protein
MLGITFLFKVNNNETLRFGKFVLENHDNDINIYELINKEASSIIDEYLKYNCYYSLRKISIVILGVQENVNVDDFEREYNDNLLDLYAFYNSVQLVKYSYKG